MQINKDAVVQFHYDLYLNQDERLESSRNTEPMAYLHGAGNIIPGLEQALEGKAAGDQLDVTIPPEQGYGPHKEGMQQRIPLKYLKHVKGKLKPGMQVPVQTDQGQRTVTILKVGLKTADVDGNHPLAGKTLRFVVDVMAVREATAEEKSHRHAHGVGGHQH